jgi:hypothetical protein
MIVGIGGLSITCPRQAITGFWTPAKIATAVWLDANDSATITLNGSVVSQWNDKSGNGNNAAQSDNAKRPTYNATLLNSQGGLVYDGSNDCLQIPNLTLSTFVSVFAVVKQLNTGKAFWFEHSAQADTQEGFYFSGYDFYTTYLRRSGVNTFASAASAWPGTADEVFSLVFRSSPPSAGQSPIVFKSGTAVSLSYGTITTPANTNVTATLNIGARNNGAVVPMNANLHEFIICNTDLDTDTRQKMEGYLAWKWGLQGNLPAGHPYKNARP